MKVKPPASCRLAWGVYLVQLGLHFFLWLIVSRHQVTEFLGHIWFCRCRRLDACQDNFRPLKGDRSPMRKQVHEGCKLGSWGADQGVVNDHVIAVMDLSLLGL